MPADTFDLCAFAAPFGIMQTWYMDGTAGGGGQDEVAAMIDAALADPRPSVPMADVVVETLARDT